MVGFLYMSFSSSLDFLMISRSRQLICFLMLGKDVCCGAWSWRGVLSSQS